MIPILPMPSLENSSLLRDTNAFATILRRHVLSMTHLGGASHVASCLSVADIIAVLFGAVARHSADRPQDPSRDRVVLSKGHAAAVLYAALAESGYFSVDELATFYKNGARLSGHVSNGVPGVEVSTGSLGHGLPIAVGMALNGQRSDHRFRVFAILSDGECDEGSVWEAAMFASHNKLRSLVTVIDYNKMQSLGSVEATMGLEPLSDKWRAFGWTTTEVDGHDHGALRQALAQNDTSAPTCIIAHTTKGKGVSFMENQVLWHYRPPSAEELAKALALLETT